MKGNGVNISEGKNLVGAFHEPVGVIADLDFLHTLPRKHFQSGLAEIIKCGFIADPLILDLLESDTNHLCHANSDVLRELIERSIAVKTRIVSNDLHESGQREYLNYGHTLAHAIERCEQYRWPHGDAVAVGSIFAAELALERGLIDADTLTRHRTVIASVGLPTSYSGACLTDLIDAMGMDKKVRADQLRFVLLNGVGHPHVYAVNPDELVTAAQRVGIHV